MEIENITTLNPQNKAQDTRRLFVRDGDRIIDFIQVKIQDGDKEEWTLKMMVMLWL